MIKFPYKRAVYGDAGIDFGKMCPSLGRCSSELRKSFSKVSSGNERARAVYSFTYQDYYITPSQLEVTVS